MNTHQALYRRWRAQTFGQIVGQRAVVDTLRNAVRLDRIPHGLLFVGPRGTGKTSMARIVAKAANCMELRDGEPCDRCDACVSIRDGRALDVVEMDAASNNKVDDMRELLPRVYTAASDLRRKVFIVDEVQRIKEGWDVLLKTLEEPPDGVLFIFCTTSPGQIRPAVVSRLQRFSFRPLTTAEIEGKLRRILDADERSADPEAISLIASAAAGGMRDAEAMLDQVLNSAGDPIGVEQVRELLGLADEVSVDAFIGALVTGDVPEGVAVLDQLETGGRDLVTFADQLIARLRVLLVERLAGRDPGPLPAGISAAALARSARRITGLDANRSSAGGFRFQLELCLFLSLPEAISLPAEPVPSLPPVAAPQTRATATAPEDSSAPRSPAVAASTPPADELKRLITGWPTIVSLVGRNPAYRPLVEACRPVDISGGVVLLGFPEDKRFLRDRAEQKRGVFEEAVAQVMGRAYTVRCVAANVELGTPADADAANLFEHAKRVFEGDLVGVDEIT